MIIVGSTPEHIFVLPCDVSEIKDLRITYAQDNDIVFQKHKDDCVLSGNEVHTKLTQEETLKLDCEKMLNIQIKAKDNADDVLICEQFRICVKDCLDKEVI